MAGGISRRSCRAVSASLSRRRPARRAGERRGRAPREPRLSQRRASVRFDGATWHGVGPNPASVSVPAVRGGELMARAKKSRSKLSELEGQPDPRAALDAACLLSACQGVLARLEVDLLERTKGVVGGDERARGALRGREEGRAHRGELRRMDGAAGDAGGGGVGAVCSCGRWRIAGCSSRGGWPGLGRGQPAPVLPAGAVADRARLPADGVSRARAPPGREGSVRRPAQPGLEAIAVRGGREGAAGAVPPAERDDAGVPVRPGVDAVPRRPLPGHLGGRAQAVCAAADAGLHRGVHPRPDARAGDPAVRARRHDADRSDVRQRALPARRVRPAVRAPAARRAGRRCADLRGEGAGLRVRRGYQPVRRRDRAVPADAVVPGEGRIQEACRGAGAAAARGGGGLAADQRAASAGRAVAPGGRGVARLARGGVHARRRTRGQGGFVSPVRRGRGQSAVHHGQGQSPS